MDIDKTKCKLLDLADELKHLAERLSTKGIPLRDYEKEMIRVVCYREIQSNLEEASFMFLRGDAARMKDCLSNVQYLVDDYL